MTASHAPVLSRSEDRPPQPARLARLRRRLEDAGLGGFLVVHPPNIRYLSGFSGSSAFLLVLREETHLLTDFRYEEQAASEIPSDVSLRVAREGLFPELGALCGSLTGIGRVGFEPARVTVRDHGELRERCADLSWMEADGEVEALRARKGPEELALLRCAVEAAREALDHTLKRVEEGATELELVAELEYALRRAGSGPPPFEPIVAGGPRSSLPHARPGDRPLAEGDLLLFDFGAEVGGYCSDLTRTFVLGSARDWQRDVHGAVEEARGAAVEALRPGTPCREVDAVARAVLDRHGYGERFGHSTGHGIGLEIHEDPRLSRRSEEVVREGHVVTVEPGVYLPGRGGVRIEDDVAVGEDGPVLLGEVPRELREL